MLPTQGSSQKKIKEGVVLRSKDIWVFLTTSNIFCLQKGGSPLFHSLARSLHEVSECPLYHAQREWSIFRFEVQVYPLNVYK